MGVKADYTKISLLSPKEARAVVKLNLCCLENQDCALRMKCLKMYDEYLEHRQYNRWLREFNGMRREK